MRFQEFLERWQNNPSTTLQVALLTRIADALRESPDCTGAVVVGSFAKESADRLSDIDLVVFCSEGGAHSLLQTINQQIAPSKVLFTFDGMHDPDSPFQKLVFEDMSSIEFHVVSPRMELTVEQPFIEIVNRDSYLESRTSPRLAATKRDMTVFRYGDRFLAWELFNCLKWLWRGDYAAAKRYLVKLGKAIETSEGGDRSLS
jgi:predicted nucleotidyltransferase